MNNFQFINSQKAYQTKFFQFPQVLLYGQQYRTLSDGAKLGYMVLYDRLNYSISNNWVDDENHVFFIFTNEELQELFNWSKNKVSRIKAELERAHLLYQKKMGFNPKTKRNLPNRLYLADLEVTATDVFVQQKRTQTKRIANAFLNEKHAKALQPSGLPKMAPREIKKMSLQSPATSGLPKMAPREIVDNSGLPKMAQYLNYTEDTKKIHKDTQLDFSQTNYSVKELAAQEKDLVAHSVDLFLDNPMFVLNREGTALLQAWCKTVAQEKRTIRVILNARNQVKKDYKESYPNGQDDALLNFSFDDTDDLKYETTKALRRYFNVVKSKQIAKEKITSYDNLLFVTMRNFFAEYLNKLLQAKDSRS